MIDFNISAFTGKELDYIRQAVEHHKICGDGHFTKKCTDWIKQNFGVRNAFLTTSCTHALEMSSILCDISPGDEVIMPSYTFVSTADAFVMRGARIVFIDVHPDTMNMDENLIEPAITKRTKAIVPVHYAGVSCEMDKIMKIAKKHKLMVVEDAAQAVMSSYKGKSLGTIGDFGCYSFHETKNYSMGEGGALLFNNDHYREKAEVTREKGTNRGKFFRGQVDKYTWVDFGSSYLPSDINAAYLYAQLEIAYEINENRLSNWNCYYDNLKELEKRGYLKLPFIPPYCEHNAHMFYIKADSLQTRTKLIEFLKGRGVQSVFHYVPLHSSPAGKKFGKFAGEDKYTTQHSERLLRLPLYYNLEKEKLIYVISCVKEFYQGGH